MIINGTEYNSDLIITPTEIISDWWRKESHLVTLDDLPKFDWSFYHSVIFGTGQSGEMKVDKSLKDHLSSKNIPFLIKRTPIAVKEFNRSVYIRKLGIFHLTC